MRIRTSKVMVLDLNKVDYALQVGGKAPVSGVGV